MRRPRSSTGWMARSRGWGLALALALSCGAARAAESGGDGGGLTLFVEEIVVEGAEQTSADVIVAESLLAPGTAYTERELAHAVRRIARLPLVLDADLALRKGSERGRHVLVIAVEEARVWFFGVNVEANNGDDPFEVDGISFLIAPVDDDNEEITVGWRRAVGRYGEVSAAVDPFDGGLFQVGYTHYNLFDRRAQLSVTAFYSPGDVGELIGLETRGGQVTLGLPVRGNHALRWAAEYRLAESDPPVLGLREEAVSTELAWLYNTLDDPVFPSRGAFVEAGVEVARREEERVTRRLDGVLVNVASSARLVRGKVLGERYWAVGSKGSVSLSARAIGSSIDDEDGRLVSGLRSFVAAAGGGYSRFLWSDTVRPRWRQLRWENELEFAYEEFSESTFFPFFSRSSLQLSTALKYRTNWGIFRFAFTFYDRDLEA